jgi:hypothetical protein
VLGYVNYKCPQKTAVSKRTQDLEKLRFQGSLKNAETRHISQTNCSEKNFTKSIKNTRRRKFSHEIKGQWSSSDRIYQLERIILPPIGATARRRILEEVMENAGAIGMIEWWNHGIVQKPWRDFEVVLILKRRQ